MKTVAIRRVIKATAFASLVGLGASASQAALFTMDLRAVSGGTNSVVTDSKNVKVKAGGIVNLELWASIENLDGDRTNDRFFQAHGSFSSSDGGLLGNLGGVALAPAMNGTSNVGAQSNLDADTDLDWGSLATTGSNPWFQALVTSPGLAGVGSGAGPTEFKIGTLSFAATDGAPVGKTTQVNFVPRVKTDGTVVSQRIFQFTNDFNGTPVGITASDPRFALGAGITINGVAGFRSANLKTTPENAVLPGAVDVTGTNPLYNSNALPIIPAADKGSVAVTAPADIANGPEYVLLWLNGTPAQIDAVTGDASLGDARITSGTEFDKWTHQFGSAPTVGIKFNAGLGGSGYFNWDFSGDAQVAKIAIVPEPASLSLLGLGALGLLARRRRA